MNKKRESLSLSLCLMLCGEAKSVSKIMDASRQRVETGDDNFDEATGFI